MKKRTSVVVLFTIAAALFGTIIGPGPASGTSMMSFFVVRGGWRAVFLPALTVILASIGYYYAIEIARLKKTSKYTEVYKLLYGKTYKVFRWGMEFATLYVLYTTTTILVIQAGSIATDLGINRWIGVIVMSLLGLIGSLFGASGFRKVQGIMTIVLLLGLVTIYVSAISTGWDNLTQVVSSRWVPETSTPFNAWYWGLIYSVSCVSLVFSILPNHNELKSKNDSKKTIAMAAIMIAGFFLLATISILAFVPETLTADIPIMYIVKTHFPSIAYIVYTFGLILALLTTIVGICFTVVVRFGPKNEEKPSMLRQALPAVILLVVCALSSVLGVQGFYGKLVPLSNFTGTFFMYLPLVVMGPVVVRKLRKEEAEQEKKLAESLEVE